MARIGGKFLQNDYVQEVPSGLVNGSNVTYTLSYEPNDSNYVEVFLDGLKVKRTDYTVSSTTLTMGTAPATAQIIEVAYFKEN